jgi:cytochrome P450
MFHDVTLQYGSLVRIELGGYRMIVVTDPAHVKHILQDNNHNYRIGATFDKTRPVVGVGLTTNSDEDSWRIQRRLMQPAFHQQYLGTFADRIVSQIDEMLSGWQDKANHQTRFNITDELLYLNQMILGMILFSQKWQGASDPILHALEVVRVYMARRVRAIVTIPGQIPTPRNLIFWRAVRLLDTFAYDQISQRRNCEPDQQDILGMLMQARSDDAPDGMSDTQLHDEIMSLFFAAAEDPANAISWAIYLLSQHPEAMQKLRTEVDQVLGTRRPTLQDLIALPYTANVVDETMRLYPPTWGILRDAIQADRIGEYEVPAGSVMIMNAYLTHRLPDYWSEPDTFKPERFDEEKRSARFTYYPFGGGPRRCIGSGLALMEMQLMLAMIVQRYDVDVLTDKPVRPDAQSSLRPHDGITVRLRSRH